MNWDLTYHFKNQEEFEKSLEEVNKLVEQFKEYEGKLSNEEYFVKYFLLTRKFENDASRVYQYASLKSDLNKKDVENAANLNRCRMALYALSEVVSYAEPEIISIGEKKVMEFIDRNPEIAEFRFSLEKLFRGAKHVLDASSEKLLSLYAPITSSAAELYSALAVGDGKNQEVKLKNKKVVTVTQGNYRSLIASSDNATDRKKIFEAVFRTFDEHKTTYATIYNNVLQTNKATSKARNYDSVLESYLYNDNIPTKVFTNLIEVAGKYNKSLKKYIRLRKKYLGLKQYHTYDRFLELAHSNKEYTYEEAKELFFNSISQFPQDFQDKAHEVLKDGFVDVMEKVGKRTGAYSSSVANLHPFILLNFDNTLDSVFTVAHEAGHSIHSMYATQTQPTMLQDYTIFVSEIASTFNEHTLLDYFLSLPDATKEEKIMVIQKAIDEIMGTFYRQTLFAEYEYLANNEVAKGNPINHQVLSQIMIDLYKKYYGLDITKEGVKQYVWAYIPHLFYTPFYVYQYATSFAASFKIYKDVKEKVPGAFNRYINLLKSGGSKYPVDQAKEAGVDFTKKDAYMAVVERMDNLVDELEKLLNA